jgi:hypothetical protein
MSYSKNSLKKSEFGPNKFWPEKQKCGVCGQDVNSGKLLCQNCISECQFIQVTQHERER